jgi:hypothetical protein
MSVFIQLLLYLSAARASGVWKNTRSTYGFSFVKDHVSSGVVGIAEIFSDHMLLLPWRPYQLLLNKGLNRRSR